MFLKTALDRLYRHIHRNPGIFAAVYWISIGLVYYGLSFDSSLSERAVRSVGTFDPGFISFVAAYGLVAIFAIGIYVWLSLTNPYRQRPSREQRFDAISILVFFGFGLTVLLVALVFLVAGPDSGM